MGRDRSVSLWGGRGARQILRLKYPSAMVDDRTHDMAHTEEGVERVRAMGFNWVLLICSWGFPPEDEEVDWEIFRRAVRLYHEADIRVCGGVQVSSCVAQKSYQDKTWYALDPWGKRIPHHKGRFCACWHDLEWQETVQDRIRVVVEAGADGVFFGAPWMGSIPLEIGRGLLGVVGCHDERCRAAYSEAADGAIIPAKLNVRDARVQRYLRWRAEQTARHLRGWGDFARRLNPSIVLGIEGYAAVRQNPFVQYGHDVAELAMGSSTFLVGGDLPRLEPDLRLIQNAVALEGARSVADETIVVGHVGPRRPDADMVWPERRFVIAMAEAISLNSPPMVSGTEFVYRRNLTLLIHAHYARQQKAIKAVNRWLEKHAHWLRERTNASPLAVYYPREALRWNWNKVAPVVWGASQTLIRHGLPFRIVAEGDWHGVKTLIVPPGSGEGLDRRLEEFVEDGGRVIALQQVRTGGAGRPLWTQYRPARSSWLHWPLVRRLTYRIGVMLWRLYHTSSPARFALRRMRRFRFVSLGDSFPLPPTDEQVALLDAIGEDFRPRVEGEGAVLFTIWREPDGTEQWHLVNYHQEPQRITLHAPHFVGGWVFSPSEGEAVKVFGTAIIVTVDDYKVLRLYPEREKPEVKPPEPRI